jgi:hypothetical protein
MKALFCLHGFVLIVLQYLLSASAADSSVDPKKPWSVNGIVVTESGDPIADATITAHAGIGSLHMTGRATSDKEGKFEMSFGPGVWSESLDLVQAATISVHKHGWFETNLYRQGDLLAAHKLPTGEIGWGKKSAEDVFLPGKPKTLKFTLKPAASISGTLSDLDGKPIKGIRLGVTGSELHPSTSVFAEIKTNENGEFKFDSLPTTFELKIYFETGKNGRDWPSYTLLLREPKHFRITAIRSRDSFTLQSDPPMEILRQTTREESKK